MSRAARSTSSHGVPTTAAATAGGLGLVQHGVGVGQLGGDVAGDDAARGVAAVAVHRPAEVAQDDLAGPDHPIAAVVVRARRVLAGGDDGEVDLVVALGEQPGRDVRRDLGLGAPDERDLAAVELVGDPVGRGPGGAQGVDLGGVLDHPQRPDDVDRSPERGARQLRQQLDEEAGPHLVADGGRRGAGGEAGDDRRRVLRLAPRQQAEHAGLLDHARRLQAGHDHRRLAVARHDEHRQALQRHRLVPGEVGQVVTDRQQQHVDALVGHRRAHPVQPVEVDRAHRASLPRTDVLE